MIRKKSNRRREKKSQKEEQDKEENRDKQQGTETTAPEVPVDTMAQIETPFTNKESTEEEIYVHWSCDGLKNKRKAVENAHRAQSL